jgi:PAS domain S-box-containing protein
MARTDGTRSTSLAELRERVAELERERELLNAIANTAPSLLCLIDPDGTVRPFATNKAFEHRLDYEPGETSGVRFWERHVPTEDAADVRAAIEAVVAGEEPTFHEGRWLTKAGEVVHVQWSCDPLPMIASGPLYLLSASDVTDRKQHEAEVKRSRARIVAAADEARKRLERNLHDGAQQRLVAVLLALRLSRTRVDQSPEALQALEAAIAELGAAVDELRELARGIHPAALTERGLVTAVSGVAHRSPVPVTLDVTDARFPEPVEAAAYFVVSESLANVARYAHAEGASVRIREEAGILAVEVRDDGVGGADESGGTGLRGLADRVAALDGTFAVESPPGGGTRVFAEIPLA